MGPPLSQAGRRGCQSGHFFAIERRVRRGVDEVDGRLVAIHGRLVRGMLGKDRQMGCPRNPWHGAMLAQGLPQLRGDYLERRGGSLEVASLRLVARGLPSPVCR